MQVDLTTLVAAGITRFIPPVYHDYESVITEALSLFFERVEADSHDAILASLTALDINASPEDQLISVIGHCPTLHKLGQVLARDPRLDSSIREQLQQLETFPATASPESLDLLIRDTLGAAIEHYEIEWKAVDAIEASVAFVVPATWIRPDTGRRERAMLKTLKPNMELKLNTELGALSEIANLLDSRCEELNLPKISYRETFDAIRTLLIEETDLVTEFKNLKEVWARYRTQSHLQVPRPLEFSTDSCLAMRFMPGKKITDAAATMSPSARKSLASKLTTALLFDVVFSRDETTIIHGDPHAGNLLYTTDHRIGLLDWSLIERINTHDREAMASILLGAMRLSQRKMREGLQQLGATVSNEVATDEAIARALTPLRKGKLPGIRWFTEFFDDLLNNGTVFPSQLVMLRKNLFTLEGVLEDIAPGFSLDKELAKYVAKHFALDWPRRITTRPFSKDYTLPLATSELIGLYASLPLTMARFLKQSGSDRKS